MGHESRKHALLSPSSASRWLNCTPSAKLECQFEEGKESLYAKEGTLAHEFGELGILRTNNLIDKREYNKRVKTLRKNELYSEEIEEEISKYVNIVNEEFKAAKAEDENTLLKVESKFDITKYVPESFGTGDTTILSKNFIHILDLKYGKGLEVSAVNNDQLMLYGLGAYWAYNFFFDSIKTVKLSIVQPRLNNYSTFEISLEKLLKWGEKEVVPKAKLAFEGKGLQKSGDWCRWCKAAPRCATLAANNMKTLKHDFKAPHFLNDNQLLEVYNQFEKITGWVKSVREYMLSEALAGKKFKGLKLVEGKSNRKWKDEEKLKGALVLYGFTNEQITNVKLKGIGDIEKLCKGIDFPLSSYTIKPSAAPTLVSESDKRKEYNTLGKVKDDFK